MHSETQIRMAAMNSSIHLTPATSNDIPELARISGSISVSDPHTKLKAIAKGFGSEPEDIARYHSGCMQPVYESAFQNELRDIIIARDDTGAILGSVVWARSPSSNETSSNDVTPIVAFEPPSVAKNDISTLEGITNQAMKHYIREIAPPGTPCRYVVSINVLPEYQNMGIGTTLMKWGLDQADREGVFCWVSSGKGSEGMYERFGFREVGRLELDLDEWAKGSLSSEGNSPQSGWGVYNWTWLIRDPPHKNLTASDGS